MATKTMDYWRDYFRNTNCDIFEVIEYSIRVAASDCPKEFRLRRDSIAEVLYSSCRCAGCYHCAVSPHRDDHQFRCKNRGHGCKYEPVGSKESKVNRSSRDDDRGESNYNSSFYGGGGGEAEVPSDEIEALSDEVEEQSRAVEEVQRIKQILINSQYESESVIYESLRRLQLMELTVGTLKVTGVGKAVNHLRKHRSKQIARLSQTLISGWKTIVDEWFMTAAAAPDPNCTSDSVNPSVVEEEEYEEDKEQDEEVEEEEEEGLPSPPLDEAFFAAQTGPIELSQFFDGMDDDGNPQSSGRFNKNRGNVPRPSVENDNFVQPRSQQMLNPSVRYSGYQQMIKREDAMKPNRPLNMRPDVKQRDGESKLQHKRTEQTLIQKRQLDNRNQGIKHSEEAAVEMKLEATKRRLQESYQQAAKDKKQKTVQVMDLHDLPDQPPRGQSHPHVRPVVRSRRLVNGRR